jgi:ribonuclease D
MDTHFLLYIHDLMRNALDGQRKHLQVLAKGREYCLNAYSKRSIDFEDIQSLKREYWKFRDRHQHKAFEQILLWRDQEARGRGKNPDMIVAIDDVYNIAKRLPTSYNGIRGCCAPFRQPGKWKLRRIGQILDEILMD